MNYKEVEQNLKALQYNFNELKKNITESYRTRCIQRIWNIERDLNHYYGSIIQFFKSLSGD